MWGWCSSNARTGAVAAGRGVGAGGLRHARHRPQHHRGGGGEALRLAARGPQLQPGRPQHCGAVPAKHPVPGSRSTELVIWCGVPGRPGCLGVSPCAAAPVPAGAAAGQIRTLPAGPTGLFPAHTRSMSKLIYLYHELNLL